MSLCMGCMQEIGNETICPNCGFDSSEQQSAPYLPYGTVLADRYIVGAGIDTNGESTRYLSFDKQTGNVVIICEFLPMGLFDRAEDTTELKVNYEDRLVFRKLKDEFVNYYRIVSELREFSALMDVHNVFEENNTAYVVEENEDLIPFTEYVKRSSGSIEWDIARPLFMPVISALEALHKRGVGHYAIAPKNMYITSSGKIKISGFSTENERKRGTALKSQLFKGAAAPEQYEDNFPLDEITDIYGFCATLFYALTGHLPKSAPERLKDSRLLMSTNTVKKLPPHVVSALANGLQVERETRITDFDELRSQLSVAHTAKAIQDEISRTASMSLSQGEASQKGKNGMSGTTIFIISAAVTALILGIIGVFWLMQNPLASIFGGNRVGTEPTTQATEWTGATIPKLTGMTFAEAEESVKSNPQIKLLKNINDEYSNDVAEGDIMTQNPPAGTKVDQEDTILISLTISKGKQNRELPKLEGLTIDEASKALAKQGLLATPEYQYNDKYNDGIVVGYKDGQAGDSVEYGKNVTIIISKGKEPTDESGDE
ncbi:MAG: PASTA domain-containing protein [Ruminococcus sp.]|nr:PASTA domain-containing protein [Ruminococcus sp.]